MSREAPTMGLHCYHQSSLGWCFGSHFEGWHWNHQKTDETEPIPCKRKPPDWLVGIACWQARPGPWLAALEAHWLAFGVGKWPLLTHKQGLWSSHLLHKPSCSLHRPFGIQAVPVIKVPRKSSAHNKWAVSENFSCIVNCNIQTERKTEENGKLGNEAQWTVENLSLSVWSFLFYCLDFKDESNKQN